MKIKYLVFLFTTLLGISSCTKEKEKAEESSKFSLSDSLNNSMLLSTVAEETVENTLQFTGKVSAFENHQVKVSPLVDGIIENMHIELGDYVTRGQTLAVIKSTDVADVENQTIASKSDLLTAQKNLSVAEDLFKAGLASEKELVLAKNEILKAQGALKRADDVTGIYSIKNSLYSVKAPISGYIVEKNPDITDKMAFREGETGSFFTIADLSEIQVIANVYESDIAKIKLGEEAKIKILSYPDKIFTGKIDKINNVLDPETRTIQVRINIKNKNTLLKPEMFAQINIVQEGGSKMATIPAEALIFDKSKNFVLVFKTRQNIEVREVRLSQTNDGKAYIADGLKTGEKVMTRNQLLVYNALNN